jgi:hypothetical protein
VNRIINMWFKGKRIGSPTSSAENGLRRTDEMKREIEIKTPDPFASPLRDKLYNVYGMRLNGTMKREADGKDS